MDFTFALQCVILNHILYFTYWFICWNHQLSVNIIAIASLVMVTKVYNCNESFPHFWLILWKSRTDIQKAYRQRLKEENNADYLQREKDWLTMFCINH